MGNTPTTVGARIERKTRYADTESDGDCRIGDVVFYDGNVWLVCPDPPKRKLHSYFIRLERVTYEEEIHMQRCVTQSSSCALVRRADSRFTGQKLATWRAAFTSTLGHYTDVLDDAPLLQRTLQNDAELWRQHKNLDRLSDANMREERRMALRMQGAANLVRAIPMATLQEPRVSRRYAVQVDTTHGLQ